LAAEAGADLLFAPSIDQVYPPGFSTTVEVLGITERLEGAARGSEHFRGVCTVVTKLLCMASPDVAYFGQKDAQQVVVIRRLVRDLNLPVRSRSARPCASPTAWRCPAATPCSADERARALSLYRALDAAAARAAARASAPPRPC
jgi:pantoate--beta-alanine ligase